MLVIGSANSSNSQRLVDVTRDLGVPAHLIDDESQILDSWLAGVETVGITSGASAPEWLVERVVDWFRERGVEEVAEHHLIEENVHFALPRGVREAQGAAGLIGSATGSGDPQPQLARGVDAVGIAHGARRPSAARDASTLAPSHEVEDGCAVLRRQAASLPSTDARARHSREPGSSSGGERSSRAYGSSA